MKKIVFIISVFCLSVQAINAQIIFNNDTTICSTQPFLLAAVSSTLDSLNTDDVYTGIQDIGFPFTFYGNTYTKLIVSSNGYITFDTTNAGGGSPWVIGTAIPNPGIEPENAIMAPWQDTDPNIGGVIYYGSFGIAPNRIYIVTWCAVPMFSGACNSLISTSQLFLHEGSNKIEMFIQDKPLCIAWNGGAAVQGLVDATSINSNIVIDPVSGLPRNFPLTWTAANEGWEFLPNGPASYTINQIPFQIPAVGVTTWYDAAGDSIGTGAYLSVTPLVTTTYYANMPISCSGGSFSDSVTITINPTFNINTSVVNTSCLGNDGSVTLSPDIISTQPPWDIDLLDANNVVIQNATNVNSNSFTFSNLYPGTYIVRVFDAAGCSNQSTFIVSQSQNPITINSNVVGVSCYNDNNGHIGVWAAGGLLPYTYYINGVLNTNAFPLDSSFLNLFEGIYIISVVDVDSCMIRDTVEITAPGYPLQALASSKILICNGSSDGEVVGSAAGGTPGYIYEWFDSGFTSFSNNNTAFGLSAGAYYLRVEDANGCDTFTSVTVIEPQVPLQGSPQVFNISCNGDSSGMIIGDASGSWAPYTYKWFDQNNTLIQSTPSYILTRDTLANLVAGIYLLTITDAQDCSIDYTFNIDEPDFPLSIDSMKVISSISCYGDSVGSARLYVSGGDPLYSYLWDNGETGIIANELTSGWHIVTLTDDWGCEILDSIYILENTLIESDLVVDTTVSCYGDTTGIASISSFGGASPTYTYFWSQGQTTFTANTDVAYNLLHGSYYVTTRDDLGCEVVDSIYISEPNPLTMEASELDWIDCFGYDNGEAFSVAQGGTSPYSFSWDSGTWIGDTIYTLPPGLHTVIVTDARECTATDTIFTHEPPSLYIDIDDLQTVLPYCLGVNTASLSAVAGGGNPSYTYEWDDNLVQPQTTATATALLAGTYTITVTDSKGCTASDTRTIMNTNTMAAQVVSLSSMQYIGIYDISCFGEDDGLATVEVSGAHAPYSYQWYGPNGYVSTNDTITDLLAGFYSVTVRDTNDCVVNSSINLIEPDLIYFTILGYLDESCLGACDGEIQVDVSGGVSPYVAMMTEATTGNITTVIMSAANNSVVAGLCSGVYTLAFTDENGCPSTLINGGVNQQTISPNNITVAQINMSSISTILCNGSATGELEALSPNTSVGYTYSWQDSNGNVVSNTTTASNLLAGTYVLYADYNNITGCTVTDTATVTELSIINPSVVVTHVDCDGNATGMLQGSVQGGTSPYNMLWNPGGILGSTANSLIAGTYTLTITDSNNCQETDTFEVTQPQELFVSIDSVGYVLTASTPTGGTAPYSYSWREQSNALNEIGTGLSYVVSNYGTYYVIVTDVNGCTVESNSVSFNASWDCIGSVCVDPGDGNGLYSSLSSCEALCLATEINVILGEVILNIYPNPFKDETTVDFGRKVNKATVTIVDVYGKLIEKHELTNIDKHIITKNNKASGVYFMEIECEGVQIFNKIILE